MNFQGRLTDISGNPLNGSYDMQIKLWDSPTVGTARYVETRLAANGQAVTVTNGLFSLKLGTGGGGTVSTGALNTVFATYPSLYFEITVGAETLGARSLVATSAYAFNSDTLDGLDSSAFGQLGANNSFTGTNLITNTSASAFIVNNGTNIFKVDNSGTGQVVIGTSDTNATVLVLDSNASDPTGTAGAMYYNTSGKFRCYQGGAWADCVTAASTLQTAYSASGSPATITTTAAKGVSIAAGAAPTADIFTVSNAGQPNVTNGVSGLQINYEGGAAAIEASGARIDLTPGTTSGSTWNGMRVVANPTGAVSGVSLNGIKLEGPTTPGAGTETGMYIGTGWDTGLDVQSGGLNLAGYTSGGSPADPPTPTGDNLRVYAKKVSGRMLLKMKGPSGVDNPLQPALFGNNIVLWTPLSGSTVTGGFGTTWVTSSGGATATHPTPSLTAPAMSNQMHRYQKLNVITTTNQALGVRANGTDAYQFWNGNAAGLGGYFFTTRFIVAAYPGPTIRLFAGLSATATEMVTSDTAQNNSVGLWHDTTDNATTVNLITKNATTPTKKAITLSNALAAGNSYDWFMFMKPNDTTIYYRLDDLVNGVTYEGNTATTLPVSTAFMAPQVEMSNGTANITASTVGIGVNRIYIESDH